MICTVGELNAMDLGTHMHVMEEWNEEPGFNWQPATVVLHGYYTRVIQEDGMGGLHIATYITNGEGDLASLRVYCDRPANARRRPQIHSFETNEAIKRDHICGTEYWYHEDKGKFNLDPSDPLQHADRR